MSRIIAKHPFGTHHALRFTRYWLLAFALAACAGIGSPATVTPPPPPTPTLTTPDPEGTARTFLAAWERGDYAGMYSLLSPLSQDAISPDDFQARYQTLQRIATVNSVETDVLSSLKNGETAQVRYSVRWRTGVVGDIVRETAMTLIYTDGRWTIAWSDGMILPELEGQGDGNTLVMEYTRPARANIYDRNGQGLARQGDAVEVSVVPNQISDEAGVLAALANLLGQSPEAIQRKYTGVPGDWTIHIGVASAEDVQANFDTLTGLGGIHLKRYATRFYPMGGIAPQVIGYMTSISPEALPEYQAKGYTGDEIVGGAGLEAWGEPYLAGTRGGKITVVTPNGQIATGLAESQPQPAQAIYTTLDRDLQLAAKEALGDFTGAIVILNPQTGEVLAMVSNPGFDPNIFDPVNGDANAQGEVFNDPLTPLLNRATQGVYPPGSVFKIPVMSAALLSGLYTRDSTYTCTGVWDGLGPEALKYDWTVTFGVPPHGKIDLVQALAFSCDPYFYTVAYDLYQYNPDYVSQIARQFGLGQPTGIEQVAETAALIPDPEWKLTTYGEPWTPGDSVNMGIGQGYVLVTPLQIAQMMAAVQNGGALYRPQLVHHIVPPGGGPTFEFAPIVSGQLPVTPEQLALIQEGLRDVTQIQGGTARHRFLGLEIPVAGKTGTAEAPAQGAPHAWFVGYTDAHRPDRPDLAMVVLVENKGEGSEYAAPIFRRIVEIYFLGRAYTLYPWEPGFADSGSATPTPGP
jgi:penicillin-binding protein 2